jgi:hypothetical protein
VSQKWRNNTSISFAALVSVNIGTETELEECAARSDCSRMRWTPKISRRADFSKQKQESKRWNSVSLAFGIQQEELFFINHVNIVRAGKQLRGNEMNRIEKLITGGCQCGAVRYRSEAVMNNAHLCHCRMCQKAMGNLFAALVAVPKDALAWTRGTPASWRSSANAERGFCGTCGTPLFYNDVTSDRIGITVGSLDNPRTFPPVTHDGIEGRMPWLATLNAVPDFGETEQLSQAEWAAAIRASNRQHPDHDTKAWPPPGGGD